MSINRKDLTYLTLSKEEGVALKAALTFYKQSRKSLDSGHLPVVSSLLQTYFSGGALIEGKT